MITIRLLQRFSFSHLDIPAGMIIAVPAAKARELVALGVAALVEPEHAVIEPQETRAQPVPAGRQRAVRVKQNATF